MKQNEKTNPEVAHVIDSYLSQLNLTVREVATNYSINYRSLRKLQKQGNGTLSILVSTVRMLKENLDCKESFVQFWHELGEAMVRDSLDFDKNPSFASRKNDRFSTNSASREPLKTVSLYTLSAEIYPTHEPNSAYQKLRRKMGRLDADELAKRGYRKGRPIPPSAASYIRHCLESVEESNGK